jgi:hypothetical protein
MSLPWIQVDQSAFARAGELAALLGIGKAQALGHLGFLWRWALDLGPEDVPPLGVLEGRAAVIRLEAGAEWTGERGALFAALVDLGLVEGDAEALRVRGLDRYATAHAKQARDRERKAKWRAERETGRGRDADGTRTSAGRDEDGARKMKIETETKREEASEALSADADLPLVAAFVATVPDPGLGDLATAWNEITTLGRVIAMPPDRRKRAQAALKRRPLAQWREVFAKAEASAFCRGEDGGWRADFDWAIRPGGTKPEPALRLLEGSYDRTGSGAPAAPKRPKYGDSLPVTLQPWEMP